MISYLKLPNLPEKLSAENYVPKMSALLYCEEVADCLQMAQMSLRVTMGHLGFERQRRDSL